MSLTADLELLTEDMPLELNPTSYNDPATPAPPSTGNYAIKLNRYGLKKNKDGQIVLWTGHRVLTLQSAEITDPIDDARKFRLGRFGQDFGLKPFMREGKEASNLADIVRAIDQTKGFTTVNQGLALLEELLNAGGEPRVKLDWMAVDQEYIDQALAEAGLTGARSADLSEEQRALKNAIYRKGELKGMYQFPKKANGGFSPIWAGVDGTKQIEAVSYIVRFYPSLDPVKLGPSR